MKPIPISFLAGLCLLAFARPADARLWTLQNGQSLDAEFSECQGNMVILENAGGRRVGIPIATFSPADQNAICEQAAEAFALDAWRAADNLWTLSATVFMERGTRLGLEWVDENTTARSQHPCLRLDGRRVWELLVHFENDRAGHLIASLYNRGDSGRISLAEFKPLLNSIQEDLTRWAGSVPSPVRESRGPAQTRLFARAWVRQPHQAILQWSVSTDGTPEFIRLRLSPASGGGPGGTAAATTAILGSSTRPQAPMLTSMALRARVRSEPGGDLLIADVPMVDQGQKGYCAAAVTERVLRYFGRDFDQHQVAQMAGSTAEGGTSSEDLVTAASRIARNLDLNFRKLVYMDVAKYLELIENYNRAARRKKLPPFVHGQMIDVNSMYHEMDFATFREVRTARPTEIRRFFTNVQDYVRMGIPLIWGVELGLVAENPELPQTAGGHMRLIIGANPRTNEILYSDSWGSAHALKRMGLDDAWTITTGLYVMMPRNIR
ncbi:MAG: hypothetical protein GX803_08010 [Lentisphaerae bacterium]|jgi:hypothetical protein|nr:hypothetical protein [Lentisphaerota bacterium]